jgi:hypothetical protein
MYFAEQGGSLIRDDHRMSIVVQWIRTSWTKRSRGGAEAARRNAAPMGFALPNTLESSFLHKVVMCERDGFAPFSSLGKLDEVDMQLLEADDRLRVQPRVSPLLVCRLAADGRPRFVLFLASGSAGS